MNLKRKGNMMKIYAINQFLELEIFPSEKKFLENGKGWVHPNWMKVVRTVELMEFYDEPYHAGSIVHTSKQIAAYEIMHHQYLKLTNKQ